ncbi:MAG: hypothetical protein H7227_06325 [Actinobacteria bacterium]|nr:hypothetical protein [Actinomycetota bacterium]
MAVNRVNSYLRQLMDGRLQKDETGTVAILTIGLFLVAVAALALITDVAAIGVAKRSLIHITEAAALHGSHALDLREYYRNGANPGVPIDCYKARQQVNEELNSLNESGPELNRPELAQIEVIHFRCAGSDLELTTSATVNLPFRLPQSSVGNVEIHATVGVESERRG